MILQFLQIAFTEALTFMVVRVSPGELTLGNLNEKQIKKMPAFTGGSSVQAGVDPVYCRALFFFGS